MGKHAEAESNFPYHPRRQGVCHLAHVQLILLTIKEATSATLRSLGLNLELYLTTAVFFNCVTKDMLLTFSVSCFCDMGIVTAPPYRKHCEQKG